MEGRSIVSHGSDVTDQPVWATLIHYNSPHNLRMAAIQSLELWSNFQQQFLFLYESLTEALTSNFALSAAATRSRGFRSNLLCRHYSQFYWRGRSRRQSEKHSIYVCTTLSYEQKKLESKCGADSFSSATMDAKPYLEISVAPIAIGDLTEENWQRKDALSWRCFLCIHSSA